MAREWEAKEFGLVFWDGASVNHMYISAENKWDYQLTIQDDPLLSVLAEMIIAGRPDGIKDVPKALWPYHGQCDGLIVCGEVIIVGIDSPRTFREMKVPVQSKTVCLLAWHQQRYWMIYWCMPHLSKTSTSGTKATTEVNTTWMTMAIPRSWLHDVWWMWILQLLLTTTQRCL